MDKTTLVDNQIHDGQSLVDTLLHEGFEVTAAFWLKNSEDDRWYFYVVSPLVESEGIAKAYRLLSSRMRLLPPPGWAQSLSTKLLAPGDPIARDVLAHLRRAPGAGARPVRGTGRIFGNLCVEDTYFYPLPAAAPV